MLQQYCRGFLQRNHRAHLISNWTRHPPLLFITRVHPFQASVHSLGFIVKTPVPAISSNAKWLAGITATAAVPVVHPTATRTLPREIPPLRRKTARKLPVATSSASGPKLACPLLHTVDTVGDRIIAAAAAIRCRLFRFKVLALVVFVHVDLRLVEDAGDIKQAEAELALLVGLKLVTCKKVKIGQRFYILQVVWPSELVQGQREGRGRL